MRACKEAKKCFGKNLVMTLIMVLLFSAVLVGSPALCAAPPQLDQIESRINAGKMEKNDIDALTDYSLAHKNEAKPHVLLGRLYSSFGFGELAAQEFQAALQLNKVQPDVWILLINERYRHTKVMDAYNLLKEAESLFPNNPRLTLARGNLLMRQQNYEEALKCFARANELKPDDSEILVGQSSALYFLRRFQEALQVAQRATALKSNYGPAYLAQAQPLLNMGKSSEALTKLKEGFKYDPFNRGLVTLYLSQAEVQQQYMDALEAALAKMGLDVNVDELLGDDKDKVQELIAILLGKGYTDEQIEKVIYGILSKLEGSQHEGKYLFCLGDIFDTFKKTEQGIKFYRLGLQKEPTFGRAWLRLGEDLELEGKTSEALECYRKAYALKREDPEIVDRLRIMERRQNDLAWQLRQILRQAMKGNSGTAGQK